MKRIIFFIFVGLIFSLFNYAYGHKKELNKLETTNECKRCHLKNIDFFGKDLSEFDFYLTNFIDANLTNTNLSKSYLSLTNLSGANLSGANLSDANLSGGNLSGADLEKSILKKIKIENILFCNTKLPWGIDNSGC